MVYVLADAPLAHLLHRRPRALSLPTGHAPIASGGSNSCRVGYLPPTGSTCPFHGARFLRVSRAPPRRPSLPGKTNLGENASGLCTSSEQKSTCKNRCKRAHQIGA